MNRRQYRDYSFKLLFHACFYQGEEIREQADTYLEGCMVPEEDQLLIGDEERADLSRRLDLILAHLPEIDRQITDAAQDWRPGRMNRVDLTIIRLAIYEIQFDDNVPNKVAVNEAVELAKKYGGDDSPLFVNGVLSRFMKDEV